MGSYLLPATIPCCLTKPGCRPATTCPVTTCAWTCCVRRRFTRLVPFKGEASYWSADIDGKTHDGIVWAYETPIPAATDIAGLLSFYPDRAEITVDGEAVKP
jgi:hypothetical protein